MRKYFRNKKWKKIIKDSGMFDVKHYIFTYSDLRQKGIDPIVHYINHGAQEGRNPSEFFNTSFYTNHYEDLKQAKINPLVHYILYGKDEKRVTNRNKESFQGISENISLIENDKLIEIENYKNKYLTNIVNPINININLLEDIEVPIFKNPEVSIIIPAYNQAKYTYNTINSILKSNSKISYEIIVMDDNSTQDEARNLNNKIKNIQFIQNKINQGFLKNCNIGAKKANGKYILFLNNDTFVLEHWLDSLVDSMEHDEFIGMIGSKLVYPDGRLQEAGGIIWNDASGWNYGRLDNPNKSEYNYLKEVDYISGASIMISQKLWNQIGGFDERYAPAYYEDSDLAFEVKKHGYKVVYQPKSVVVHFEGISNGTDVNSGIKKYQVINKKKFFNKWKSVLETENYSNAQDIFLARDKSTKNTHILFVDHYLPHYDQDAGSKATFQYLQILVNEGMKVHFIGDNFWNYPDTPYLEALTKMGIEVLEGNFYAENWENWLTDNGKYFEYIILSRPHIAMKYIDIVKEVSKAKIIYFGHDLHFLREEREYKINKKKVNLENSHHWKKIELELIQKSDTSYYFSNIEKSIIEEIDINLNVDVVPLYIFEEFKKINYMPQERRDIAFVGGFNHKANVDAMLWFIKDIWPLIQNKYKEMHFYIIGSNPPEEILNMKNEHITVTGFISDEQLETYLKGAKLIVAPLRYGAGVKGKIIDAMYNGLPIVTTSIGAEGIQNAEKFMKISNTAEEFAKSVAELYEDSTKLEYLSKESFNHCKTYFSREYAKNAMAKTIEEFRNI